MKQARVIPTFLSFEKARSSKNAENPIVSVKKDLAAQSRDKLSAAFLVLLISFLSLNLLACGGARLVGNVSNTTPSSGTETAALQSLTCQSDSVTGAGTDTCTATLSAAADSGGQAVSLTSDDAAVTVPSSVTVASGDTSASFTATIAAVTTAQTATLTASAAGKSSKHGIKLNPNSSSSPVASLNIQSATVSFGSVALNSPSYQSDTLTSSGTASLTISSATVTGKGFSISGASFPLTLSPGQTATLQIEFDPTVAGAATGKVTLTTNATPANSAISLAGTGDSGTSTASYEVNLSWDAPASSPVGIVGYNIYRSTGSGGSYQRINSAEEVSTSYTDSTVASSTSYSYYVESVDAEGDQSVPSNSYTVSVP